MTDDLDKDSTYQSALDRQHDDKPVGVAGGAHSPANVRPLRVPGTISPEANSLVLERLLAAMAMVVTINRTALEPYRIAFQTAIAACRFGDQGPAVEKQLQTLLKRLDAHVAQLPNDPGGPRVA